MESVENEDGVLYRVISLIRQRFTKKTDSIEVCILKLPALYTISDNNKYKFGPSS